MSNIFAAVAPVLAQRTRADNVDVSADNNWDLETFFQNSTKYTQNVGGAFLALIGIAGLTWGGFLGVRKLMGGQQAQADSWFKIVALIITGGAMLFGGMALLLNFAAGGKTTIENFGNGMILNQFAEVATGASHAAVMLPSLL